MAERVLGYPAYGSIGHIPGSRMGPADHHIHPGQAAMVTYTGRTGHGEQKQIWVQTKLDGSCVAAARIDDEIVALGRAGYLASSSPYEMHHLWADWVAEHSRCFMEVLEPGQRLVGEWLAQAHGTIYELKHRQPFVAFDLMEGKQRTLTQDFLEKVSPHFATPHTLEGPMDVLSAMNRLDPYGADKPEGVVYRCEGKKGVEFLAKWVRPDKVDGLYLIENDEGVRPDPIWNWQPARLEVE